MVSVNEEQDLDELSLGKLALGKQAIRWTGRRDELTLGKQELGKTSLDESTWHHSKPVILNGNHEFQAIVYTLFGLLCYNCKTHMIYTNHFSKKFPYIDLQYNRFITLNWYLLFLQKILKNENTGLPYAFLPYADSPYEPIRHMSRFANSRARRNPAGLGLRTRRLG